MDLRSAPLKKIINREGSTEYLECGHTHAKTYRKAIQRRCGQCLENINKLSFPTLTIDTVPEASDKPRCSYCHDDADDQIILCQSCKTIVHQDCAKELNNKCPIPGCRTILYQKTTTSIKFVQKTTLKINSKKRNWIFKLLSKAYNFIKNWLIKPFIAWLVDPNDIHQRP